MSSDVYSVKTGTDYYYHRIPSFDLTKDTIILNPPLLKRGTRGRLFCCVPASEFLQGNFSFFDQFDKCIRHLRIELGSFIFLQFSHGVFHA